MGVRKRHPFTAEHVAELAKLVDKEIDFAGTSIKDADARRKRQAKLFNLRAVITDIQDGDVVEEAPAETPPAAPVTPAKPRKPRQTKAEKAALKAQQAAGSKTPPPPAQT